MKILRVIRNLFRSGSVKAAEVVVETPVVQATKKSSDVVTVPVGQAVKNATPVDEDNPLLEYIYQIYERDGVSRDFVKRIVIDGERQRFYRFVGDSELSELLSGKVVTSNRACYNGRNITDVTTNPEYGKIPTIGKYRLSFKDKPEFAPYPLINEKNSRIIEHDLKDAEYYLCGGYDISDIEKIEQKLNCTDYRNIDFKG